MFLLICLLLCVVFILYLFNYLLFMCNFWVYILSLMHLYQIFHVFLLIMMSWHISSFKSEQRELYNSTLTLPQCDPQPFRDFGRPPEQLSFGTCMYLMDSFLGIRLNKNLKIGKVCYRHFRVSAPGGIDCFYLILDYCLLANSTDRSRFSHALI